MKSFEYNIKDSAGIHARSAMIISQIANIISSDVVIRNGDRQAKLDDVIGLMMLKAKAGTTVTFEVSGVSEAEDVEILKEFCKNNL